MSKKIFGIIFLISCLLSILFFADFNHQVEANRGTPWLQVTGRDIQDPQGNKIILRGIALPDLALHQYRIEESQSSKSPLELIEEMSDPSRGWYANVFRLMVNPNRRLGYNENPQGYYENFLKPAADKCLEEKVYCIIDWHYVKNPAEYADETRNFWRDIAPKFKDYPNIMFEVFNENKTKTSWAEWKEIVQPWVDLIRAAAPQNIIIVGAPHWNQHFFDTSDNPITGGNIVYAPHIYPGLAQQFWDEWIFDFADKLPMIVTEWGFRNGADYPTSGTISDFGIPLKRKMDRYNIGWTAWVADYEWMPEMFDRNWNLLVGEEYMGGFVKDYLKEKNS
ncbi:glycoside hydrolase family 5 protein [Oscillatoria salina]|uniref:glycoside hydrolase family 5 protein n=1 Tax=Oscillatoria salina TaxID=331517 RepID=UPI0013BC3631|nr:cellulase family glycosylhydrolase [Oscillatoria salina]MBZ8181009.1 glycoside hydrolase family 5 protein [Oscillatoria salina IIICB1]NET88130.1 glycoside hydrolase family 5 protein [Kamptonema sp. SIO1D9]